ncbi:MAG: ATP-dependent DNA helicase RecG, partial [Chloroflexi bacterium]|nr:ATP-dependent DNA helicase RecG [Chloroflexota bacterium]
VETSPAPTDERGRDATLRPADEDGRGLTRPHVATAPKPAPPAPPLETPIEQVKGVTPKQAQLLGRLGVTSFGDLLYDFPTRHQAYPPAGAAAELIMQPIASFVGRVEDVEISGTPRGGLHKIIATLADRTGRVTATWFRHGRFSPVKPGQVVAVSGKTSQFGRGFNFESPEWEPAGEHLEPVHTRRLVPTYPLTAGLAERWLREKVKWAVDAWADRVPDSLPDSLVGELMPLGAALRQIHFPDDEAALTLARRRLAFDELFTIQLVVVRRKLEWQGSAAPVLPTRTEPLEALLAAQPYRLTGAQRRVLGEILEDVARPRPMIRLLQGEVGSGKTAVAAAALLVAVCEGAQGSLMAPTEILAEQHFRTLAEFYGRAGEALAAAGARPPSVGLLTGNVKGAERRAVYERVANGEIDVLVGTQALIQEGVAFANLGLAVVDEQHRFGVRQRVALREKGGHPHVLVMTATPIPRTLALSLYGDLELSLIDEMPPGRKRVNTHLLAPEERGLAYEKIRREVQKERQAFVICPLVEDSSKGGFETRPYEARAATQEFERLQGGELAGLRLALLHGRMRPAEKERVMREFRDREHDVLVSTAVVEVGVDIPNATVMLIEGAERFGLAQLHQFRGRVGRSDLPSVCLLLTGEAGDGVLERLQVVAESDSGLALAEHDLRARGPGDYFGVRQSGFPELRVATLDDVALVERARRAAEQVLDHDPDLSRPEHAELARRVADFRRRAGEPN